MFRPELLSPCRDPKEHALRLLAGADAVYAGQARYSLRYATTNSITKICSSASAGPTSRQKFYVVVNIQPQLKAKPGIRDMRPVVNGAGCTHHVRSRISC